MTERDGLRQAITDRGQHDQRDDHPCCQHAHTNRQHGRLCGHEPGEAGRVRSSRPPGNNSADRHRQRGREAKRRDPIPPIMHCIREHHGPEPCGDDDEQDDWNAEQRDQRCPSTAPRPSGGSLASPRSQRNGTSLTRHIGR